jgi:hypothetical protein
LLAGSGVALSHFHGRSDAGNAQRSEAR